MLVGNFIPPLLQEILFTTLGTNVEGIKTLAINVARIIGKGAAP